MKKPSIFCSKMNIPIFFVWMFVMININCLSQDCKILAINKSFTTSCAEDDNINIPIFGNISKFKIEATHPVYPITIDNCDANFTNCNQTNDTVYKFNYGEYKPFDDGTTVFLAKRESNWWLPFGMKVIVKLTNKDSVMNNINRIEIFRRIEQTDDWPSFLVLYHDGNMRLIPQHKFGTKDPCYGSSIIIGPSDTTKRPTAIIDSLVFYPAETKLIVYYKKGGNSVISLISIDRTKTSIEIEKHFDANNAPIAVFRSMFVDKKNCDVSKISWKDTFGNMNTSSISSFSDFLSDEIVFFRDSLSNHNISASDIKIIVDKNPLQPSLITGSTTVCSSVGEPYIVTALPGITYGWEATGGIVSGSGNSVSVTWNTTGNQTLTVTPSNGCGTGPSRKMNVFVSSRPTITSTTVIFRCETRTATLAATSSAGTISWFSALTGETSLGIGTNFTTPSLTSTTVYYVEATNNGCTTTTRSPVAAKDTCSTGINNISFFENIKIYPNPTKSMVQITINEPINSNCNLELFDNIGTLKQKILINKNEKTIQINLSCYPAGFYLIKFNTKKGIFQYKIIKE